MNATRETPRLKTTTPCARFGQRRAGRFTRRRSGGYTAVMAESANLCCVKCNSILDKALFQGLEVDLCP